MQLLKANSYDQPAMACSVVPSNWTGGSGVGGGGGHLTVIFPAPFFSSVTPKGKEINNKKKEVQEEARHDSRSSVIWAAVPASRSIPNLFFFFFYFSLTPKEKKEEHPTE
jgi:hypothetical protein